MWTKRNDHVQKNECKDFSNICPKKIVLKYLKFNLNFFRLFLSSSSLLKKIHLNLIIVIFIYHGPLPFFYYNTFVSSPTAKPVGPYQ